VATADDVQTQLVGTNGDRVIVGFGGPTAHVVQSMQQKLSEAVGRPTRQEPFFYLQDLKNFKDVPLDSVDHAKAAHAWGHYIWQALEIIAAKVGADLSTIPPA